MPWFRDQYADAVWECEALRPTEKLVALTYADHAGDPENPGNDVAWVTWPRMSQRTGIRSKDSLNRAVRYLVGRGWLVLVEGRKQHRSPRYRLVIPENPEVRETYVWEESEVREPDVTPVDEQVPEVREMDLSADPEVRHANHSDTPEVRETVAEVRQTAPRGTAAGPDHITNPSTTDNPSTQDPNHRPRDKPKCQHRWTADHHCRFCDRYEPCRDCRQLSHVNDTIRCYQHLEEAS